MAMKSQGKSKISNIHARWTWTVFLVLTGFVTLITFQNCSNPAALTKTATDSKTGFLYDTKIDQIAYMSCSQMKSSSASDADIASYFSFRVGAYSNGGIKVADSFFTDHSTKKAEKLSALLQDSISNTSTIPQIAIRKISNLNSMITSSGTPVKDVDFGNLIGELGTAEMSDNMVAVGFNQTTKTPTGTRIKYMRSASPYGNRLEVNMNFGSSEGIAADVRDNNLNTGSAVLALTYVEPQNGTTETNVRNDYTLWPDDYKEDWTKAYGMRYNLSFARPTSAKGLTKRDSLGNVITPVTESKSYPTSLLTLVEEKDLQTPGDKTNTKTWTCDANMRFKIVRPEDIAEAVCTRSPDPATLTDFQKTVRNSFRAEDFYIDWTNKCLIPKKGAAGCYGANSYVRYAYTADDGCDPYSVESTNANKSRACLAWASICTRGN